MGVRLISLLIPMLSSVMLRAEFPHDETEDNKATAREGAGGTGGETGCADCRLKSTRESLIKPTFGLGESPFMSI
jgi:hypothetical protein